MSLSLATEFIDLLKRSRLLTEEQVEGALWSHSLQHTEDPLAVANGLVKARLLTKYQAQELLFGNWQHLVIDNYAVQYILGAGGMGWVYCARELDSEWEMAIKLLSRDRRDDDGMLARMQMEGEAGLRLKHPNILRTFSINRTEDNYGYLNYMVMEMVRGITPLELLWLEKKIDIAHACDIIRQAAIGLQYAHDNALVHRDVKPDNLMIRSNGAVKILDFGLAMRNDTDDEFSMAMIFGQDRVGTADYVAPEQTINSYHIDHRADVYGLGCTFYTILASQVPFPYSTARKKLIGHRKKKPTPLREMLPDVPKDVAAIISKMMSKSPDRRFQTCGEVARVLEPLSETREVKFNFKKMTKLRVKHAKKREAMKRKQSQTSVVSVSDLEIKPPVPEVETKVRKDTDLDD